MNLFKQEPALIIGFVQVTLALLAAFGFNLITPEQAAAIVAFVSAATLLIRSLVFSPATAEQIKEQRDILAETVLTADKTGSVPYKGTRTAKAIEGAAATIIPPALTAALVAAGFPPNFAAMVGPEAAKIALEASRNATKKALTREELRATRDAELERRAGH